MYVKKVKYSFKTSPFVVIEQLRAFIGNYFYLQTNNI